MTQYRKKPVVIEAIIWNGNTNLGEVEDFVGRKIKVELESDSAYQVGVAPPIFSFNRDQRGHYESR